MSQLLPPNRTALERRTAEALVIEPPVPLRTLWDPATCPAHLLPFLAWAYSVDHWSSAWSERVQRNVIAASFDVHRMKGTRTAIDRALGALGVDVTIAEWFETTPNLERGTFNATLYVNENLVPDAPALIGPELYEELRATIDAAKNARSHYSLRVGVKFGPNTLGAGGGMSAGALSDNDARPIYRPVAATAGLVTAATATPGAFTCRDASADYRTPTLRSGLAAGAATTARAVGRFSTESRNRASIAPARLLAAATCRAFALTHRTMETPA
ncbi:phage tail protein I [Salinicola sp. V024]|uniref:phage tail protein I n=1 Tax=Salinicola sp. V024 TaxID=3459609 RepID=UPI0040449E58